ncbi:MAG: hypothetical protein R3194_04785 [Limnobacter sp.]|nr:hypothetical protein [Limnobacter sp.]
MTIRAPSCTLHERPYSPKSYEREVLFETLGCCWALSTKNADGEFSIRLLFDLSQVELLYGCPTEKLPEDTLTSLVRAFSAKSKNSDGLIQIEHNALELIQSMDSQDFLSFHAGMHDCVDQLLRNDPLWTHEVEQAYLALRYCSLNLLDASAASLHDKRNFAELLAEFVITGRKAHFGGALQRISNHQ